MLRTTFYQNKVKEFRNTVLHWKHDLNENEKFVGKSIFQVSILSRNNFSNFFLPSNNY